MQALIELFVAPRANDAVNEGDGGVLAGWGGGDDGKGGLGHFIGLKGETGMLVYVGGKSTRQLYGDKGEERW